jgi:uncharacterized membrane protein HdeD (DUF308 family)
MCGCRDEIGMPRILLVSDPVRRRVEAVEPKEDPVTQPQAALPAETGHWWALALRGVIAILFGLAALLRPGIALEALILLFGAYALVDGVFAIVGVFGGTRSGTPRWLLLVEGIVSILAGLIALVVPGLAAVALLYLVAAWAVVTGLAQIATAIRLRQEIRGEWALILGGILSVLFGLLLAVLPGVGILSLIWLIGAYAVAFGVLLLITSFQVRGRDNQGDERPRRVT